MPSDWVTKQPKVYACSPSCEQCALLRWPLQDTFDDDAKAAWAAFCDAQRRS